MRADFVVIGGGVTGLATTWALARRGCDVMALEQAAIGHVGGGSHGACRIFRLGYEDPQYVTLARQARELWTELEAACGERLLHPTPQLTFGPLMPQVHDAMRAAGASYEMLSAAQSAERFPGVAAVGQVLLEPESAVIAADRVLAALTNGIGSGRRIAGADDPAGPEPDDAARSGVRVTALADDGRRVRVSTSDGDIDAGRVIVCAGPWSAGLLAPAGIAVPTSATMEQVTYLAPASTAPPSSAPANAIPIFVHYGGEFPYGLPVPGSDRYKIGIHHGGPAVRPDQQDHAENAELSRRIERAARSFLPAFDPRPVAVERCVYDNSPDTDFIVDRIGNVVLGCGTSGHGFKFAPLLGEWLASLATDGTGLPGQDGAAIEPAPRRFSLDRF